MQKAVGTGLQLTRRRISRPFCSLTIIIMDRASYCTAASEILTKEELGNKEEKCFFRPQKVLILSKMTRLEYERLIHPSLDEDSLKNVLARRGSNYERLRERHDEHEQFLNVVVDELRSHGMETRTVQRFDYDDAAVSWADAVFSAGGDGTFLLAASRISSTKKPVIGINTSPQNSEGHLCLLKKLSHEYFGDALKRLLSGNFRWLYRQRIRIRLEGDMGDIEPVHLHEQKLRTHIFNKNYVARLFTYIVLPKSFFGHKFCFIFYILYYTCFRNVQNSSSRRAKNIAENVAPHVLPVLALNDVFVGENLSSRVSYYEIQCDDGEMVKQKSSGVVACTGSGSSSWFYNMNKLTDYCVSDILDIVSQEIANSTLLEDKSLVRRIRDSYNSRLLFEPDCQKLAYCIRDPIYNETYREFPPRGLVKRIRLRSHCYDAHLVIDGRVAYKFNDGSEAVLEVFPEDAIKTVVFR